MWSFRILRMHRNNAAKAEYGNGALSRTPSGVCAESKNIYAHLAFARTKMSEEG